MRACWPTKVILLLVCSLVVPQISIAESKFKVGTILALSGDAALLGEACKNGMLLAYKSLPPEKQAKLELLFEDDALKPTSTVTAYQKLKDVNKLDLVVTWSSGTSHALAPIAERDKIPMIAIASDPRIIEGKKYAFNFWVTPEEETRAALPEALKRGYKKIARIYAQHEGPISINRIFDRENKGQIEIVLDQEALGDQRDFRTFITKLNAIPNVDAISVVLFPGQLATFAKQLREMGSKVPMFGWEMMEDANENKLSGGALTDAWYVNADDPSPKFMNDYKAAYPEASVVTASNGYDIVLLVSAALDKGITREGMADYLRTVKNFSGSMGTYSASGDNRFTLPAAVKIVTADGFKKIG